MTTSVFSLANIVNKIKIKISMNPFIELKLLDVKDKLPGATAAYFQTAHSTVAYTEMKAGAEIPLHKHVNEAVDIILEGELEMKIGERTEILKPGMMSFVPSNVLHKARALSDCKAVTILHPQKEL